MKNTLKIHHTFAQKSTSYTKRANVFHLRLADQSELLLQADSERDMFAWIDTINFASACLSSPALPCAISNGASYDSSPRNRKQQTSSPPKGHSTRPILPASYTRLSYWEQLIDHEERLQRLKLDLDNHLSQASETMNATKRGKTEFIDRIAYLKQEIERYSVYVDLMRKKSNSPEAIILSKHPQIASLTPSEEMIMSLPGFAPAATLATTTLDTQQRQSNQTTVVSTVQLSAPTWSTGLAESKHLFTSNIVKEKINSILFVVINPQRLYKFMIINARCCVRTPSKIWLSRFRFPPNGPLCFSIWGGLKVNIYWPSTDCLLEFQTMEFRS